MSFWGRKINIILAGFLLVVGVIYAVFIPELGVEQDKAKEAFQKGLKLYYNYNYNASADFFLESLSYQPEFYLARRMLGQSMYFSGEVDEALNEWKMLLDQNNYDPSLQIHMQDVHTLSDIPENNWRFFKEVKSSIGYRYGHPVFTDFLPNNDLLLLSIGDKGEANLLLMNSNGSFTENLRRVSGKLEMPVAAAFDGEVLWITDIKADKIHRLKMKSRINQGWYLTKMDGVGATGAEPLHFHGPAGICYNGESLIVTDYGNNRLQKIGKDGTFLQEIKNLDKNQQLYQPYGLACNSEHIYVSEPDHSRIVVFDFYGNYLESFGSEYLATPRNLYLHENKLVITDERKGVFTVDLTNRTFTLIDSYMSRESTEEKIIRPYSAALDGYGNMFVADYGSSKLLQFVPEQFLYSNLELWVEKVYSENFPDVGVWVSVKDQLGNYLKTLNSENFQVYENDADVGRVGFSYLKTFQNQGSWVILLSKSLSMKKYTDSLEWLSDFFLNELREQDQVKVLSYNNEFRVDSEWGNSRLKIHQTLLYSAPGDYLDNEAAAQYRALDAGISDLLPQKGKRALIWITEGIISKDKNSDINMTRIENYARINHVPVFIISFEDSDLQGYKANRDYLKKIAANSNGAYFSAYKDNMASIEKALRNLAEERYVLTYKSLAPKSWKGQYMELKVKVKFQGRNGMESSGYFIE